MTVELLESWIARTGVGPEAGQFLATLVALLALAILAIIVDRIARQVITTTMVRIARRSKATWDDHLAQHRVFHHAARLIPAMLLHAAAPIVLARYPGAIAPFETLAMIWIALIVVVTLNATMNAMLDAYNRTPLSKRVPLKPFVQLVQGIIVGAAVIVVIARLLGQSPGALLGGLGAFTAVLLLVFREPILGLASGIQLISNNMVRRGDWITVPRFGADGDVIDVALTTVSVQNFDKTISTIPTHALITDTFRNWRGMEESDGRRIKRAVNIDMQSIRFLDEELMAQMRKVAVLRDYFDQKERELAEANSHADPQHPANLRRLTNVGTFRAYLVHYLRNHPQINLDMTFLVRQLAPTPQGLPIEIYVFSKDKRWIEYEGIQADIFDHILAIVPHFDLRVFQEPTGADLRQLKTAD